VNNIKWKHIKPVNDENGDILAGRTDRIPRRAWVVGALFLIDLGP